MAEVWPVRRRMPRITAISAPREQLLALLLVELMPEIARFGDELDLPGPHKCGTPNHYRQGESERDDKGHQTGSFVESAWRD